MFTLIIPFPVHSLYFNAHYNVQNVRFIKAERRNERKLALIGFNNWFSWLRQITVRCSLFVALPKDR